MEIVLHIIHLQWHPQMVATMKNVQVKQLAQAHFITMRMLRGVSARI